jgi:hypothetical protein
VTGAALSILGLGVLAFGLIEGRSYGRLGTARGDPRRTPRRLTSPQLVA